MNLGEGRKNKIKAESEANHNRLLTITNKLRVAGGEEGGGCAKWVMCIKGGTWCEHWVFYISGESLNLTPQTSATLYLNFYFK